MLKIQSFLILILSMSTHSFATTWTVDDDGVDFPDADFDNIQDAIDVAVDGDIVNVYPGTYTSTDTQVVNMLGKMGADNCRRSI